MFQRPWHFLPLWARSDFDELACILGTLSFLSSSHSKPSKWFSWPLWLLAGSLHTIVLSPLSLSMALTLKCLCLFLSLKVWKFPLLQLPSQARFVEPIGCSINLWVSFYDTSLISELERVPSVHTCTNSMPTWQSSPESSVTPCSHWTWHRVSSLHPVDPLNALLAESHRILRNSVFPLDTSSFWTQNRVPLWTLCAFSMPTWQRFYRTFNDYVFSVPSSA